MDDRRLRIAGGTDHPVDQVARQNEFEAAHPEVTIRSPLETGTGLFEASWSDGGGEGRIADADLRWLLDELDKRFPR